MKSLIDSTLAICEYIPHLEQADEAQISPLLVSPENFLRRLVGENIYEGIISSPSASLAQEAGRRYIFLRGLADGLPLLDLVLTANGFAVVSNENLAPASKDRVQSLRSSLLALSDDAYADFIESAFPYCSPLSPLYSLFSTSVFVHSREYKEAGGARDFKSIQSLVDGISSRHLRPLLGDKLFSVILLESRKGVSVGAHDCLKRLFVDLIENISTSPFSISFFDSFFDFLENHSDFSALFSTSPYVRLRSASEQPSVQSRTFFGGV